MPPFPHLTIEAARTLSRNELLPRLEAEQAYWLRRIERGLTQWNDADYQTFRRIMDAAVDPRRIGAETLAAVQALAQGRPRDEGYFTRPLGERGEL